MMATTREGLRNSENIDIAQKRLEHAQLEQLCQDRRTMGPCLDLFSLCGVRAALSKHVHTHTHTQPHTHPYIKHFEHCRPVCVCVCVCVSIFTSI